MSKYEQLLIENQHIKIKDNVKLPKGYDGVCTDFVIFIDKDLPERRKHEILHEELAHHKLTYGNILDQSHFNNRKFENYARRYSYETTMPLSGIVEAFKQGIHNLYELANFFEISEGHVLDCIEHYKRKYGLNTLVGNHLIEFEPLRVFEYKTIKLRRINNGRKSKEKRK
ncbi:ImmA/IrrE family metallo-endopeptidase [Staphylococcus chromogenes]|uniref:ImmA/IrrE family metallo-endopeptidase n=1 Tax=Staphylococcus chromogenes TaxID=46126 RepID=UPI002900F718|nr:ImmA/IrrE family metallo-endopeptidase [Staphylococcus chromogenes]MDU0476315.1 ImmA/IrrE family metallo-endopeptidase [Staphylococcus chromogenes]